MEDKARVKVYTTSWCVYCRMAKEYFRGKGVDFEEINVEENREAATALVERTGQAGVPVIEIGQQTILGFDRERIDLALREYKLV